MKKLLRHCLVQSDSHREAAEWIQQNPDTLSAGMSYQCHIAKSEAYLEMAVEIERRMEETKVHPLFGSLKTFFNQDPLIIVAKLLGFFGLILFLQHLIDRLF
ncbi:hypothetical protein SAMN04487969_1552 [Paenibacillus algorifonticola]|uniref:Uncharacterized protein n=1 Tax=Paenibacillus algorifonticola TaxID=684063 RepID=A0A1I2J3Q7_9BACL|nr:hypothetical protein [Paenibacillus algorifonticola]SFF49315.1 hypothetical protein SAMN04487969_1552 [Paenibacillus algorifonticola]